MHWNPSKTKIPIIIGKGTDADKPISEAPHAGQQGELGMVTPTRDASLARLSKDRIYDDTKINVKWNFSVHKKYATI